MGLVVAVLLLDLGLAGAGAVLLMKGLARDESSASDAKSAPSPEQKTELPPESAPAAGTTSYAAAPSAAAGGAPEVVAAGTAPVGATAADAPASNPIPPESGLADKLAAAARGDGAKPREATNTVDSRSVKTPGKPQASSTPPAPGSAKPPAAAPPAAAPKPAEPDKAADAAKPREPTSSSDQASPSAPQDPYPAADTRREVDASAARSKAAFDRCAADHGPAQGTVEVAFQVRGDGRIANAAAVENTTGSAELARCLVAEISSWRVTPHDGAAINMSRPFTFR